MKVVKADFQILERDEQRGGLAIIETAGRTCYKSEANIGPGSAERFVANCIRRKHEAMLEHGDYIFTFDDKHIYDNIAEGLQMIRDMGYQAPMLEMTCINNRPIVSGNIRAWRELFGFGSLAGAYVISHMDPIYTQGFYDTGADPDPRVHQIFYSDLEDRFEKLAHQRHTVRFTIDRGVSHEFVRHRTMSFAQESTRYCNYANDKFGTEICTVEPFYLQHEDLSLWRRSAMSDEVAYMHLISVGHTPQEARTLLPTGTKTELVMTGNLRNWQHFFDLRARQVTGPAHPQALEVAVPLYETDKLLFPGVIV